MAAQEDEQAIRPFQSRFDQMKMAPMKGLEPSDKDGNIECHGDLRIPEMKPASPAGISLLPPERGECQGRSQSWRTVAESGAVL